MPSAWRSTWRKASDDPKENKKIVADMNELLRDAVFIAKGLAPVRTGALRDDIDYRPARRVHDRIVGQWGNHIKYAKFQNDGTEHTPATHYLDRAWEQAKNNG